MEGIIFDLDGTITDSERVHRKTYKLAMERMGCKVEEGDLLAFMVKNQGVPDKKFAEKLVEEFSIEGEAEELARIKGDCYQDLIGKEVSAYPGVVDLIKKLGESYKLALATSARPVDLEKVLDHIGLGDAFDEKVSGSGLKNPKPAPDIFFLTAEKLGVDIGKCLIFEDSENGLAAATASGARVIAYDNKDGKKDYLEGYFVLEDYRGLTPSDIESIYESLGEKS